MRARVGARVRASACACARPHTCVLYTLDFDVFVILARLIRLRVVNGEINICLASLSRSIDSITYCKCEFELAVG